MNPFRLQWLFLGLQFAFLILVVLGWLWLVEAEAGHRDARKNLDESIHLSKEIIRLRGMTSIASDEQTSSTLDNARLVRLAKDSGMLERQIVSIRRLMPAGVEGTEYQRRDVVLEIQDVVLADLIAFSLKLEREADGLKVTSLTLHNRSRRPVSQPRKGVRETWSASLALTHLEFIARSGG